MAKKTEKSLVVGLDIGTSKIVAIGRTDAAARLERMAMSWPALRRQKELAPLVIDLRYSNGFAVRWPDTPPELADNR